jgi:hypothetical protein
MTDFTGILCLIAFFISMRLIGFKLFKPTMCPECEREETTASRELWVLLNNMSTTDRIYTTEHECGTSSDDEEEDVTLDSISGSIIEQLEKSTCISK